MFPSWHTTLEQWLYGRWSNVKTLKRLCNNSLTSRADWVSETSATCNFQKYLVQVEISGSWPVCSPTVLPPDHPCLGRIRWVIRRFWALLTSRMLNSLSFKTTFATTRQRNRISWWHISNMAIFSTQSRWAEWNPSMWMRKTRWVACLFVFARFFEVFCRRILLSGKEDYDVICKHILLHVKLIMCSKRKFLKIAIKPTRSTSWVQQTTNV